MLARGRPRAERSIGEPRELTQEDLAKLERPRLPAFQKFRESYHAVAKALALGLRDDEVAELTGYGLGRIYQLKADPTMQARVEAYRDMIVDPAYAAEGRDYMRELVRGRTMTMRICNDKLADTDPEDISFRDLIGLNTFFADRSGFGKTTSVKIEQDLSDRLAQALAASAKVINARPLKVVNEGVTGTEVVVGKPVGPHATTVIIGGTE